MSEATEILPPTEQEIFFSLEKNADSKERKSYELQTIAPLLNKVFSHLNHMNIEADQELDQPFLITTTDDKEQLFPRRVFHIPEERLNNPRRVYKYDSFSERGPAELPVFSMKVVIGNSFNIIRDLPNFIKEVQEQHNSKMIEYGIDSPMMFVDTSKQLQDYWQFMSEKLSDFIEENKDQISTIKDTKEIVKRSLGKSLIIPTLKAYQGVCSLLSQGFSNVEDSSSELESEVDSKPFFEMEWQKTEESLKNILTRLIESQDELLDKKDLKTKVSILVSKLIGKGDSKKTASGPLGRYKDDPKKFLFRAIGIIGSKAQSEILEKMNTQSRDVFFHHCESEMYRKVGLDDLFSRLRPTDDVAQVLLDKIWMENSGLHRGQYRNHAFIRKIYERFPKSKKPLEILRKKLLDNKELLLKAKEGDSKHVLDSLIEERSRLQLGLARKISALVYSEKLFSYKKDNYSFADVIETNQVNCMVIGELFHQFWIEYCGEETLGALSKAHFFSIIKLANGKLLSLEKKDLYYTSKDSKLTYEIGKHEDLYQAAIFGWKATEVSEEIPTNYQQEMSINEYMDKVLLQKQLIRESIRLAPNDPSFKHKLANLLSKDLSTYNEALYLYKEAVALSAPNDPWKITSLANFYHFKLNYKDKALVQYKKALSIMNRSSSSKNWLSKVVIEKRILDLSTPLV